MKLLKEFFGLLKGCGVARDDQCATVDRRLHEHLNSLAAVHRLRTEHAARCEVSQVLRNLLHIAALNVIGAQRRLWWQWNAIEFGNERFETDTTLFRCFNDQRVRCRIGSNEHFLRLLQVWKRSTA